MRIRREVVNKLRGFSFNRPQNNSILTSLNSSFGINQDQEFIKQNNYDSQEEEENNINTDGQLLNISQQQLQQTNINQSSKPNPNNNQVLKRFYEELDIINTHDEGKVMEILRKLLKMDPAKRTFRECMSIYKLLKTTNFVIDVVQNIGFKILIRLCKHLIYDTVEEKQFVYHEGQTSDKVYILLNGKLCQTIKNKQQQQDQIINEYNKFDDFGKIEVQNNIKRNSSVYAIKKSEICYIDKQTYNDIIGQLKSKPSDYFINQLLLFQCFQSLSKNKLLSLIPIMQIQSYDRKSIVFKEKDKAKEIYFILDGDFKLYSTAVVATNHHSGEYVLNTSYLSNETQDLFKIRHNLKKIQLAIYSKGEIIGSEDLLNEEEIRTSELVCESERGRLFSISRQDLEARIEEDDPFWQNLLDIALMKIDNKQRKLDQLTNPSRKTNLNKEVVLSSKRISLERKIIPNKQQQNQFEESKRSSIIDNKNRFSQFEVHVNQCLNNKSQEKLNTSFVSSERKLTSSALLQHISSLQNKNKNDEQESTQITSFQSAADIPSCQQLEEQPLSLLQISNNNNNQNNSNNNNQLFITNTLFRPKKNVYSHRNSYLSNITSSTYESSGLDTQDTLQSKCKNQQLCARQNFQIMNNNNNTCSSGFSNILPPKQNNNNVVVRINKRNERVLSQESMKTQESFNLDTQQQMNYQSMTQRTYTKNNNNNKNNTMNNKMNKSMLIRKQNLNRSMDNLEIRNKSQDDIYYDDNNNENDQYDSLEENSNKQNKLRDSQEINKYLGGSTVDECYKEIKNNLKKKNIIIQENKEFNDIHMNYNYLRSSRIDRNSVKLNRISQKLLANNINTNINNINNNTNNTNNNNRNMSKMKSQLLDNEIDITRNSRVSIKQIANNVCKLSYTNITPNTFFTSFKLNHSKNNQNLNQNQSFYIPNPRAIRSSYSSLKPNHQYPHNIHQDINNNNTLTHRNNLSQENIINHQKIYNNNNNNVQLNNNNNNNNNNNFMNCQDEENNNEKCIKSISTGQNENGNNTTITQLTEFIPTFNHMSTHNTYENTRYKQIKIKKKAVINYLNSSLC